MKPIPSDCSIEDYQFPAYEAPITAAAERVSDLPPTEGFAPLDPANPSPHVDSLPVVQNAVFQDFKQVLPPEQQA